MTIVKNMKRLIPILMMLLALTGCAFFKPYQPDIQQGNVITPQMVQQLQVGMSPTEVEEVMGGPPVLVNVFSSQRKLYVYTLRRGKGKTKKSQLLLTFDHNKLIKINLCLKIQD